MKADAGNESVALTESDSRLHGTVAIKGLRKSDAAFSLTLADKGGATLVSFTGFLASNGAVTLTESAVKGAPDIDALAADVFPAASGYTLAFDFHGADAADVVSAKVALTDAGKGAAGEIGKAEMNVDFRSVGSVWTGPATVPAGPVDVKSTAYDGSGKKLEKATTHLAEAWDDGASGVNALAIDEDPMTSVAKLSDQVHADGTPMFDLTVVSDGWSVGDALPVSASIELDGGTTISIPVNSAQVAGFAAERIAAPRVPFYTVTVEKTAITSNGNAALTPADLETPACGGGYCVVFSNTGTGAYNVGVSAYGTDAAKLPSTATVTISGVDKGGKVLSTSVQKVMFDNDIALVFANAFSFSADPIDVDVSGKITLLGAADKKGKTATLAKGKFYGTINRDDDGDLSLAGADKDTISAKGDILIGGEPIDFELTDTDKNGVIDAPPAVVSYKFDGFGEGWARVTMVSRL